MIIYTPVQIKQRIASREQIHTKTGSSSSVSIIGKDIKSALDEILDYLASTGGGGVTTASNGLVVVGSDVQLGGPLTANVSIAGAGKSLTLGSTSSLLSTVTTNSTGAVTFNVTDSIGSPTYVSTMVLDPTQVLIEYVDNVGGGVGAFNMAGSAGIWEYAMGSTLTAIKLNVSGVGLESGSNFCAFQRTTNLTSDWNFEWPNNPGTVALQQYSVQKAGDTMSGDLSTGTGTSVKLKGVSQGTASLGSLQYNNYIQMSNVGSTGVGMRIYSEKVLTPAHNSTSIFSPLSNSQFITDGTTQTISLFNNSQINLQYNNGAGISATVNVSAVGPFLSFNGSGINNTLQIYSDGLHLNLGGTSDAIIKTTNLTNVRTFQIIDVDSTIPGLSAGTTPASSSATGKKGEMRTDGTYFYLCIANNTWLRSPMVTW